MGDNSYHFPENTLGWGQFVLSIPLEKRERVEYMLNRFIHKSKVTVQDLQSLCGYLNFLNKAVVPGRVFTRRMYAKFGGITNTERYPQVVFEKLKKHHHVRLDAEFKVDCQVWLAFLNSDLKRVVNRPMIDLHKTLQATDIGYYSDASAAQTLGFGCTFGCKWVFGQWPEGFIKTCEPSIEYIELFGLCAGLLSWSTDIMDC